MIDPRFSRRAAKLKFAPSIMALELPARFAFFDRCEKAETYDGLSDDDKQLFLRAELESLDLVAESAATLSLPRSIAWHLERLTDAEAARFCEEAGLEPLTAEEFRQQWDGDSWDDLALLIYIRREDEPDGE